MNLRYNILYQKKVIHENLTADQCSEILSEMIEHFYSEETLNPDDLELEVT